jgi:hypothetical protein
MKTYRIVAVSTLLLGLAGAGGCASLSPMFRADLTNVLAGARGQLSACYAEALVRNPKLAGQVTLKFTVQPNTGRFTGVTVAQSQIKDRDFEKCVATVVGEQHVAAPPMIVEIVDFPVSFTPTR